MNPEDVGKILDEIGERIGPAGAYAWELTVRQVVIDAWVWGGLGVALVLAAVVSFIVAAFRRSEGAAAIGLFAGFFGVPTTFYFVTQILNPEYHAMQKLLTTVLR